MNKNIKTKIIYAFLPILLSSGCSNLNFWRSNTDEATLYWTKGDYENAIQYANKAIKDNPEDAYALMIAANSYEALGYPNQSRRYYEDMLMIKENSDVGIFNSIKKMPPDTLKAAALQRLRDMELKDKPYTSVNPETRVVSFTDTAFKQDNQTVKTMMGDEFTLAKSEIKGGLAMLDEADKNVVQRFLTFTKLRDEKYVTPKEWQLRRTINLGGLLPYTLEPAGLGLDLPSPSADTIIGRMNALRTALEMRTITPREHAAEREMILEALLPSNPFHRMTPLAPPKDMLEGATALRRIEMLKNLALITPEEADNEQKAINKLVYTKLGMDGDNLDQNYTASSSSCIKKCLAQPSCPCCQQQTKEKAPVKKKAAPKKKAPKKAPVKQECKCS